MSIHAEVGLIPLGMSRCGDGLETTIRPRAFALTLTYTVVVSKYTVPLQITATIERRNVAPLLIYYQVTANQAFAINGTPLIVQPDQVTYALRPVIGRTLIAGPLLQGIPTVIWNYSVLQLDEFTAIIGFYNAQNPLVTIVYPDETGTWLQKKAVMQPPMFGNRQTMFVFNVSLTFLLPFTMG